MKVDGSSYNVCQRLLNQYSRRVVQIWFHKGTKKIQIQAYNYTSWDVEIAIAFTSGDVLEE